MPEATVASVNPKARDRFEARAQAIRAVFQPFKGAEEVGGWAPDRIPAGEIKDKQILGPIIRQRPNIKTLRIDQIVILDREQAFMLGADGCAELDKLSETIGLDQGMRRLTTVAAVRNRLLQWLVNSLLGSDPSAGAMEHVEKETNADVRQREIWIPLSGIDVEVELRIGNVELRPISGDQLKRWRDATDASGEHVERYFEAFSKRWQGTTAAVVTITSDRDYAAEVAMDEAKRTTAVLRLLEADNPSASGLSYLQPPARC